MSQRILVKCPRPGTAYAEIRPGIDHLLIFYGNYVELDLCLWEFMPIAHETLSYREHPELRAVFDGWGWNLGELHDLLESCCPESSEPVVELLQ